MHFITRGWINRNKILINGEAKYLTIPCKKASQNRLINEIEHALNQKNRNKLLRSVKFTYSNAPFFDAVFPMVESVLTSELKYISELAVKSVKLCAEYMKLGTDFALSSKRYDNRALDGADRLIDICKQEGTTRYLNAMGGGENG